MKKYITITISILLLITITTPFTVNAKTAKETLLENVVTTKDGLYKDEYEEGRYIYKGENPKNYITFNNEYAGWRIIAIEKDGTIKIIKEQYVANIPFNTINDNNGTYCEKAKGGKRCNAWAATENLTENSEDFELWGNKGTVLNDCYTNQYLNKIYYKTLTEQAKSQIINYNYNVDEKNPGRYYWNGKIAIIDLFDYNKANEWLDTFIRDSSTLTPLKQANDNRPVFLAYIDTHYPEDSESYNYIYSAYVPEENNVYPVIHLNKNLKLSGKGTQDNPYTIESEVTINLETFGDLDKDLQFKLDTAGKTLSEIKEEIDDQIGTKIEKDGKCCTLDSWYLDKDLKNRFDEDTPINNNLTLFGRWECRETETVNVPNTLLQIPNWIINLGCSITIVGILLIVFIIKKKNTRNEE